MSLFLFRFARERKGTSACVDLCLKVSKLANDKRNRFDANMIAIAKELMKNVMRKNEKTKKTFRDFLSWFLRDEFVRSNSILSYI